MSGRFSKKEQSHFELVTPSGEEYLSKKTEAWQIYPRPQMRRKEYQLLNGEWMLDGKVTHVPFPPQSRLSGYNGIINDTIVYEKSFELADALKEKLEEKTERILLHFGAVDQVARVWINDVFVGDHEGGYLPFYFDITDAVCEGSNLLRVEAIDTLSREYPYGKQTKQPGGMWYTPVSGIWQSVWMECVPVCHIVNMKITPDLDGIDIEVFLSSHTKENAMVSVTLHNGQVIEHQLDGLKGRIELRDFVLENGDMYCPKLWTTTEPYLYELSITVGEDTVESYFALRTIYIEETDAGKRVCLNGKPVFLHGVLDQGYYPDGIFLPASESEYEQDILRMKELGMNFLRKHIKIEPEAFYYACDRVGMLVMQDMVNSGTYSFLLDTALPTIGMKKRPDDLQKIRGKRKEFFVRHCEDTISHLYNHPCIVAYTIFNEGWGQFCSDRLYELVKKWDPTRLIDATSGWFAQKKNDFDSEHIYFRVKTLQVKERPLFMSECGGYSMLVEGHQYSKDKEYGYGACKNAKELTDKILYMYEHMIIPSIAQGLCGCVYTQLSDVEEEVNGLYTYDRKVCKVEKERMQQLAERIFSQI